MLTFHFTFTPPLKFEWRDSSTQLTTFAIEDEYLLIESTSVTFRIIWRLGSISMFIANLVPCWKQIVVAVVVIVIDCSGPGSLRLNVNSVFEDFQMMIRFMAIPLLSCMWNESKKLPAFNSKHSIYSIDEKVSTRLSLMVILLISVNVRCFVLRGGRDVVINW